MTSQEQSEILNLSYKGFMFAIKILRLTSDFLTCIERTLVLGIS